MIDFVVDTTEMDELVRLAPMMRLFVEQEIEEAMDECGMFLTTAVAGRTPVNFGILRSSINFPYGFATQGVASSVYEGMIRAGAIVSVGATPHEYANYVEFGTRPHWAPIGPLALWANRIGKDDDFAKMVQFKIAKKGTEGQHMFERAWNEVGRNFVEKRFGEVPVKAVQRMSKGFTI